MRHQYRRRSFISGLALACCMLTGCATTDIAPPPEAPAPPSVRFGTFDRVAMRKPTIDPAYAQHPANQKALAAIERHLLREFGGVFPGMQLLEPDAAAPSEAGTLLVEPNVQKLKFIGGAARFWAGALAGSSAVLMQVTFTDTGSSETVAAPVFFQRAAAYGGAWSVGATDNNMLHRIAEVAAEYAQQNR